jgi:hemoglobin
VEAVTTPEPVRPKESFYAAVGGELTTLFLIQYWGGPQTYGEQRGHPRLRMRHAPFAIAPAERDAWLARMKEAVDGLGLAPEYAEPLWDYLHGAAFAMQNTP